MKRKIIESSIAIVIAFVLSYLIVGFVNWKFSFAQMSFGERYFIVNLWIILCCAFIIYIQLNTPDK
tara:strand:- start:438 stop:635 length:198 start_codon:yes stop_codon:yes gene_type:complete